VLVWGMSLGTAGTGGASGSCGLGPRPGDGLRNVRSVIDPELDCRWGPPGRCCTAPLLLEDAELRRTMRFVTVSPTGVGVVTWVRSAAAAAALDRFGLDSRSLTNAFVAASEADALGGARWGCITGAVSIHGTAEASYSHRDARADARRGRVHLPDSTQPVCVC
jgi:hypothetical protein